MRRNVAYLFTALAVIFAALLVIDYAGDYYAARNAGNDNTDVSDDTSSSVFPTISMVKHDSKWYTDRFVKTGYKFVFGNDDRAGSATEAWLKKVQTQAADKIKNTKRDENVVFNDYIRSAMKQKGVAFLEEYESGTSYPSGRNLIIFVDDSQGETKVLEVSKDDTEFDLGSLKNPEDVLSTPEATVSVDQAASFFQNLEKKLDERLNATVSKTEPAANEKATSAKPMVQATDISFEGNAGSAQQNSGTNSGTNSGQSGTNSGQSGMVQAAEISI